MAEIGAVNAAVKPVETLLVVDAMTGQEAVTVAQAFKDAVPLTGLILTKIDGDARGGAALSISAVTGLAVKFMGTGEKTDALEVFHPDRLAGRILGMGDVMTLVERAQEHVDEEQAAKMEEKLRKAQFTLEDFLEQIQQVQKMGPMGQLMSMIPGMGGMAKEAQEAVDRGDLKRVEAIIRSMTPRERRDPAVINGSRRRRIAAGLGDRPHRRQPTDQAARRAPEADEAARRGRASGRDGRPHGPALGRRSRHDRRDEAGHESRHGQPRVAATPEDASTPLVEPAEAGAGAPAQAVARDSGTGGRPPAGRRSSGLRWAIALVGVASSSASRPRSSPSPAAARVRRSPSATCPPTRSTYGEYRLDLPGDQRQKLAAFLSAFPGFEDQARSRRSSTRSSTGSSARRPTDKQTWTADIEPWFGGQIAMGSGPVRQRRPVVGPSMSMFGGDAAVRRHDQGPGEGDRRGSSAIDRRRR